MRWIANIILILCSMMLMADEILTDKITDVTVYFSQAMVSREAEITLEKGTHELIFENLPMGYEENSVQVKGFGSATIKDVKKIREYVTEEQNERRKKIEEEIDASNQEKEILQDKKKLAEDEKIVVQNIMNKLTAKGEKENKSELNPDNWIKMVGFYRTRLSERNSELRETNKQLKSIDDELSRLHKILRELGYGNNKERNKIQVLVEAQKAGKIKLVLSYIIYNSRWYPIYDIRVASDTKILHLTYKANVVQSTGEDWRDVNLKLSTAMPHVGAEHPELNPWRLSLSNYQAQKRLQGGGAKESEMKQMHYGMSNMVNTSFDYREENEYDDLSHSEFGYETAAAQENITSSVFVIAGTNTILSDNQEHQVSIMEKEFPAHFRYSTVPKLSQYAYLKAKVVNNSEYPLLEGEANIFLDDNFVTTSYFEFAAPSEEFWTFLGVDETMKIEYKMINKFTENKAFSSKKKITYEYEIKVKNNKQTEEEIVVWDQVPISENEDIKIELIEPDYKKDTDVLKMNNDKFLEWFFQIQPGKEITIPFKFSVEYPQNKIVSGL
jgi:uncharacterized protein (TIGR02231 family)